MVKKKLEIMGRIEGIVILKFEKNHYVVENISIEGQVENESVDVLFNVINKDLEKKKFKGLVSNDFMQMFEELIEQERKTGLQQLLIIDMNTGEWQGYPIDDEMKEKFPMLSKWIQYKADYVV